MTANHEGSAMAWSPAVTTHYAEFFEALWSDSAVDPALIWSGDGPLTPLTNRAVYPALTDCLSRASERIRMVMYAIADNPDYPDSEVASLVDGLIAAEERGVDVGVIHDASAWIVDNAINDHAISRLQAGGVPIWRTPESVTTHAKVLVCDAAAGRQHRTPAGTVTARDRITAAERAAGSTPTPPARSAAR